MPTFEGNSIQDAIDNGLAALHLQREEVTIEVITEGKHGLFGIGRKPAVVNLKPITLSQPAKQIISNKTDKNKKNSVLVNATSKSSGNNKQHVKQVSANAKATTSNKKVVKQQQATKKPQDDLQVAVTKVVTYLEAVTKALHIDTTIDVTQSKDEIVFHMHTAREGFLIGKHGQKINALQYLARTVFDHQIRSSKHITLNVGDYRQRRTAVLKKVADNAAREVIATGRPYMLDAMPSFERKQIHQRLQDNKYVTTHSEGVEPHRYVVVSLQMN